jgi:adenine C2-methylase RlmN of 23S rRNA A2503 and tRNA A37
MNTTKDRDPQAIWWRERATEAGFADAQAFATAFELKPYRLAQIYRAATKELIDDFSAITVLPADLRSRLKAAVKLSSVRLEREATSRDRSRAHAPSRRPGDRVHLVAGRVRA